MRDIAETTEETGYLRFVMTERLLLSGRHHALAAVEATRRALEGGRRIESIAALLETIVEQVADTMDRMSDRIAQSLDEIEEQVLSDGIVDLRQKLGRLAAQLRPSASAVVGIAARLPPARAERSRRPEVRHCSCAPASSRSASTTSITP